jgi:RNA polymerase sigma-70 factor (ECF subfamily)
MRKNVWYKKTVKIEEVEEYYDNSSDLDVIMDVFSLPMKFKTTIYLYYFEGYSIKEISGVLKLTESAVKMRLMRGRQLLKMKLEEDYR